MDDRSTTSFTLRENGFGVSMSRNYPLPKPFQNMTQQVFCEDGMAEFNLNIVDTGISENFTLRIKNKTNILYPFTNLTISNESFYFNSSPLVIEYGSNETNLLESIGFVISYEGTSVNITSVNESSSPKYILIIVLSCLGFTIILLLWLIVFFFNRKKPISIIKSPIRNLPLRLETHNNELHESLIERITSFKNVNQLNFPNHAQSYECIMEDFEELDLIDG